MHTLLALLVAAGLQALPPGTQAPTESKPPDHVVMVKAEDREMNAAIAEARASLDLFLRLYASPPKGASGFKLKVMITDEHGNEHFWITPFRVTAHGFVGTVANAPDLVETVSEGDEITFSRDDVTDWGYELDGKQKGSYTVCVLFKHMDKEEADMYRHQYGFEC